jgi:Tfp pilus assembly ATPase PilU
MKLYKQGMISFEEAMAAATNPDDFDLRVRGIQSSADRWSQDEEKEDTPTEERSPDLGTDFTKY